MAATTSAFLNVKDIERSLEFYKRLGFKVDRAYKDDETGTLTYADLSYQGAELGLGNIEWNDEPSFREWVSTPLGAGVVLYFTVPNVDTVYAKAKEARAVIEFEPTDRPYGRLFMLNDPDGYSISFVTEPRRARAKAPKRAAAKKAGAKSGKKAAKAGKKARAAKKGAKKGGRR